GAAERYKGGEVSRDRDGKSIEGGRTSPDERFSPTAVYASCPAEQAVGTPSRSRRRGTTHRPLLLARGSRLASEMADTLPARRAAARQGRKEVLSQTSTLGMNRGGSVTEHRFGREKLRRPMRLARAQDLTPWHC